MPLDIFTDQQREANAFAVMNPATFGPELDPSFGETFGAAWSVGNRALRDIRMGKAQYDHVQEWIDRFGAAAGFQPTNPETPIAGPARDLLYRKLADDYASQKKANPTLDLPPPPSADDAHAAAISAEQKIASEAGAVASAPGGFGARAGTLLGGMAAVAADPINLAAMGVMAAMPPAELGILAFVLREGAVGAASQAAITTASYRLNQEINPDYGAGDAAMEVASAGIGGALLAGGIRGLGMAWARFKAGGNVDRVPRYIQDTGNVVEREAAIDGDNPYKGGGLDGEVAHRAAYAEAEKAVSEGRAPITPTDTFAAGTWRPSRVYAADGSGVDVRYEVVEAGDLVASQRPDLSPNPDYPAELQPRDRTRAASSEQIATMAANLEPRRLGPSPDAATGSPIVGPDSIVESGNGRVAAIRQAYETGRADAYRQHLADLGFDAEGMRQPVLVARRTSPMEPADRARFTDAANRATAMRLSAPEQALADARLLDAGALEKLTDGGVGTAENRPFVKAFFAKLPKTERAGLIDREGSLSTEGVRRVEAALLARAYGDSTLLSRILEAPDSGVKGLAGALTDAAPAWVALREAITGGHVPAYMDITRDLLDAFRLVAKARDGKTKLTELIDQAEMFAAPSPMTRALLGAMFRDEELSKAASRPAVARALRGYAEEAAKNTTEARLFGEPLSASEVLTTSLAKIGREDLAVAAEEATAPAAARTMLDDPRLDDAVLHRLEHMQNEAADLTMPHPDGLTDANGAPVMVSVKQLLDEADAEIRAAKEIEACATGNMGDGAQ